MAEKITVLQHLQTAMERVKQLTGTISKSTADAITELAGKIPTKTSELTNDSDFASLNAAEYAELDKILPKSDT